MTELQEPYGNPTDLDEQEQRRLEVERLEKRAAVVAMRDLAKLVNEPSGRRHLRRLLIKAKLYVWSDAVESQFSRHHGEMCANESHRTLALQVFWPILRLLAQGEVPFESFAQLMTETDA